MDMSTLASLGKDIPRITASELIRETIFTNSKIIIVEGQTDKSTYSYWLRRQAKANQQIDVENIHFVQAEWISELDSEEEDFQFSKRTRDTYVNDSKARCRGKVVAAARVASELDQNNVCGIVDQDLGVGDLPPNVFYTDYPALESYALHPEVLDDLNERFFKEELPPGNEIVPQMADILAQLFVIRRLNPGMKYERLRIAQGFEDEKSASSSGVQKIRNFSLLLAVGEDDWEIPDDDSVVSAGQDYRYYAYGHDVAQVLFYGFSDIFNKLRIRLNHVEALLRDRLRDWHGVEEELLYLKIEAFALNGVQYNRTPNTPGD